MLKKLKLFPMPENNWTTCSSRPIIFRSIQLHFNHTRHLTFEKMVVNNNNNNNNNMVVVVMMMMM